MSVEDEAVRGKDEEGTGKEEEEERGDIPKIPILTQG
jgi:hypothetical protein